MITVSAPGKIHLVGEHAVVYGEPAILSAVGMRTSVRLSRSENVKYIDRRWDVQANEWPVQDVLETTKRVLGIWDDCKAKGNFQELFDFIKKDRYAGYRKAVVGIALNRLGIGEGVSVEISGNVPPGAGMGSSSSLSVCLAKGIPEIFGNNFSLEEVNGLTFELEKIIHGTPSGADNSASCFGGWIWFEKGNKEKLEIPKIEAILVNSGQPQKTTGELVQQVRNLPSNIRDPAVKAIGSASREMRKVLGSGDIGKVQALVNFAQRNLKALGVSTPEIDGIVEAVQKIGGGAKLCGAGGGGIVLCLHKDLDKLSGLVKELGFEPVRTELGAEGVRND